MTDKPLESTMAVLLNEKVPIGMRKGLLGQICNDDGAHAQQLVETILTAARSANAESRAGNLIAALEKGPVRSAMFRRRCVVPSDVTRAEVMLPSGETVFPLVADPALLDTLRDGDSVLVDAQATALLQAYPEEKHTGEIARLERYREDSGRIEVSLHDRDGLLMQPTEALREQIASEEVRAGASLVVCPKRMVGIEALLPRDGLAHYRFIDRRPVPDVVASRDLGAPPAFIADIAEHARIEMTNPEARRRFKLHRCATRFLVGVSGGGKSYSIQAAWRSLYEVMSKVTGAPVEDLPPRVLCLSPSRYLSKWLGDSDKNLDRFFEEVETLASEPFTAPDGRQYELPVLAVLEEIDSLARERGSGDPVYDRILTTALQRLDTSREELRDKLIFFIATTNVADQVDPAFLRRIGATIDRFGRLDRAAFIDVLDKHLSGCPLGHDGLDDLETRRSVIAVVASWMFSPGHADPGEVELTFAGATTPVAKRCRDFLTPALIERAVQQAGEAACRNLFESGAQQELAITSSALISALHRQVRAIVDQLTERNVHNYVDLPDGVRVARLRRLRQPSMQRYELRPTG